MRGFWRAARWCTLRAVNQGPADRRFMDDPDIDTLKSKLAELMQEHRDLDDVIQRLQLDPAHDQLQLQRLKKRKLGLKDQIAKINSRLLPDIIA
jgi:hypothetical protein